MSNDVLYDLTNYIVIRTDNAIGEDGKYGADGYAVVNKLTAIVEHTNTVLPGAIYQAQSFSDAMDALSAAKETPTQLSLVGFDPIGDDVVPS